MLPGLLSWKRKAKCHHMAQWEGSRLWSPLNVNPNPRQVTSPLWASAFLSLRSWNAGSQGTWHRIWHKIKPTYLGKFPRCLLGARPSLSQVPRTKVTRQLSLTMFTVQQTGGSLLQGSVVGVMMGNEERWEHLEGSCWDPMNKLGACPQSGGRWEGGACGRVLGTQRSSVSLARLRGVGWVPFKNLDFILFFFF